MTHSARGQSGKKFLGRAAAALRAGRGSEAVLAAGRAGPPAWLLMGLARNGTGAQAVPRSAFACPAADPG
jgi:hypothetical protein